MNRSSRTVVTVLATAILVPAALSGCSDGSTDSSRGDGPDLTKRTQYAQCMRDKGYDEKDPDPNAKSEQLAMPAGVDPTKYSADMDACSEKAGLTAGNSADPAKPDASAVEERRAIGACVREKGFGDYPDDEEGQMAYQAADGTRF